VRAAAGALLLVWAAGPLAATAQARSTVLDRYDLSERSLRFNLPGRLREASGLAFTSDGRLFTHDDERAVVYEIDAGEEEVTKAFSLGDPPLRGDFEGIAVVGERFFVVTSRGLLYEFREMPDGEEAPYRVTDTELGATCEIEGLDYDPTDDALLFACKVSAPPRGTIVVHRIALGPDRGTLRPIQVPRDQLGAHGVDADFEPSAIAVDPWGTLVLLSASRHGLIEIDREGRVLAGTELSRSWHRQPEGLAFGPDGTLYIADEGDGRRARLTGYAPIR